MSNWPATGVSDQFAGFVQVAEHRTSQISVEAPGAGPFDMEQAPDAGGLFVGDYEGMTTSGTAFQPFYIQAVQAPANPTDAFFSSIP